MGLFMNNTHVYLGHALTEADERTIAGIVTRGMEAVPVETEAEADVTVSVFACEGSPWATVVSELTNDAEAQTRIARALSETLSTRVLNVACFDSDYLYLNMIDTKARADVYAACGVFPFSKSPRRSDPAAWKNYVTDVAEFRRILRGKYVFAEECLPGAAAQLSLPEAQAMADPETVPAAAHRFFYKLGQEAAVPQPSFALSDMWPTGYSVGAPVVVCFDSTGAPSTGVIVWVSGEAIAQRQVQVEKAEVVQMTPRGDAASEPVVLQEITREKGDRGLMGYAPAVRIPPAPKSDLPQRMRAERAMRQTTVVRITFHPDTRTDSFGLLQITLAPMKNVPGQAGLVMKWTGEAFSIKTRDLILRPLDGSDRDAMLAMFADVRIYATYMIPEFQNASEADGLFFRMMSCSLPGNEGHLAYAICLGGELIGYINDCGMDGRTAELGYFIHPDYRNRGFAAQALRAAIEKLFKMGYDRVEAGYFEENPASARVMEKCGMTPIGKRETVAYRGQTHTCLYRAIERTEPPKEG